MGNRYTNIKEVPHASCPPKVSHMVPAVLGFRTSMSKSEAGDGSSEICRK